MKVTIVQGSARRKGNSHDIVNALCEGFAEGTEISTYEMQALNASGCMGCMSCKGRTERCAIEDDLSEVYEKMHDSDVLVLASPVYFGDVSAQAKTFIDRLYHLYTPDFHDGIDENGLVRTDVDLSRFSRLKRGTRMVFITAQGSPFEDRYADISERYCTFFRFLGFDEVHPLRGIGNPSFYPDRNNAQEAFALARALGRELSA